MPKTLQICTHKVQTRKNKYNVIQKSAIGKKNKLFM